MKSSKKHLAIAACAVLLVSCGSRHDETSPGQPLVKLSQDKLPPADGISDRLERSKDESRCNVEMIGTVTSPLASAEAMKNIVVDSTKATPIVGWGVDSNAKALASGIELAIDGRPYKAKYGDSRPDVSAALKNPVYTKQRLLIRIARK